MESLRRNSQESFSRDQKFTSIHGQSFEEYVIVQHQNKAPEVYHNHVTEQNLRNWSLLSGQPSEATFSLLRLTIGPNHSLMISKDFFNHLFSCLGADPGILYLIQNSKDGFHYFSNKKENPGSPFPTWFVGTSRYAVFWTFNARKCATLGIFLDRKHASYDGLTQVLEQLSACIYTPLVLAFAIPLHQRQSKDLETEAGLNEMREIEKAVGFGPKSKHIGMQQTNMITSEDIGTTFTIDRLMNMSRKIHEIAGKIKNRGRIRAISIKMFEHIRQTHAAAIRDKRPCDKHFGALEDINEAASVLERQLNAYADYMDYMQYRAEHLSKVVLALLTHEDAASSIQLAVAMQRDSSSMKTIAIMTMLFLPGTFFAAVFAMPHLKWDQPDVVQNGFWIYWVCTLTCTFFIFAVWLFIVHKRWVLTKILGKRPVPS